MKEQRFLICKHCGNIVAVVEDAGVDVICCGEKMQELVPNTVDAATEKHVPVVTIDGCKVTVQVGEVPHPMLEEHYIQWIFVKTEKGGQRKLLTPGSEPKAEFCLVDDKILEVYEYCNLHGLWKTTM